MNNLFYANLFFITATAVMFMTVFVSTMLLVYIFKLITKADDILSSAKRTIEKAETVSGNLLDKVDHQSENISGLLSSVFSFLGVRNSQKKTTKSKSTKKSVQKLKKDE